MLLLATLLSHYRGHPVQGLFLLAGIVTANVLLVATLLINAQARASYDQGEQLMQFRPVAAIRAADGSREIDERDYFLLRSQGFDNLAPLLRGFALTTAGSPVELLGIDIFAMVRPGGVSGPAADRFGGLAREDISGFAFPPYQLWGAPSRLAQLGWADGTHPVLADGAVLPETRAVSGRGLGHRLLMDIGALQVFSGNAGKLSRIIVFAAPEGRMDELRRALPPHLELKAAVAGPDQAQLTASFHLNLAAMGLLAFVVGVFLTYNAVAFSYTERRELIRRIKICGVTRGELGGALLLELSLFVVAGVAIGYLLGSHLAMWLLPGVGRTLAQLYGVYIAYPDSVLGSGMALPLLMTGIAAGLSVSFPLREALAAPSLATQESGWQQQRVARRDQALFALGTAMLAVAAAVAYAAVSFRGALWLALAGMACMLLGSALILPAVLRLLLNLISRLAPKDRALAGWLLADTRWLLGPASLALMAMTLALVANSGLNTMIGSFRQATDAWLQQRLVSQLYLTSEAPLPGLKGWLAANAGGPGVEIALRYRTERDVRTPDGRLTTVDVVSKPVDERHLASVFLMRSLPGAVGRFANGEGIYVSERAMRLDGWRAGDLVQPCASREPVPVLGVYHSYGDPRSEWILSQPLFESCWPELKPVGHALFGPEDLDWAGIRLGLAAEYGLDDTQLVDQSALKAVGMSLFDRTFQVTNALNALTLLVAAIGIFCAVSAIHHHRLRQQALLISLGVTRRERGLLQIAQWGLLGLLCVLLVWPLGTALAGLLAAVVTPVAFGWSFALRPEWQHYPVLLLLAFTCLALAASLPALRLLHASPAELLKEGSG